MKAEDSELIINVMVKPRAKRDEIVDWDGETLKVRVAAPPVEGQANDRCLRIMARALGVSRSRIRIVRGATSRRKRIGIEGIDRKDLERFSRNPQPDH